MPLIVVQDGFGGSKHKTERLGLLMIALPKMLIGNTLFIFPIKGLVALFPAMEGDEKINSRSPVKAGRRPIR